MDYRAQPGPIQQIQDIVSIADAIESTKQKRLYQDYQQQMTADLQRKAAEEARIRAGQEAIAQASRTAMAPQQPEMAVPMPAVPEVAPTQPVPQMAYPLEGGWGPKAEAEIKTPAELSVAQVPTAVAPTEQKITQAVSGPATETKAKRKDLLAEIENELYGLNDQYASLAQNKDIPLDILNSFYSDRMAQLKIKSDMARDIAAARKSETVYTGMKNTAIGSEIYHSMPTDPKTGEKVWDPTFLTVALGSLATAGTISDYDKLEMGQMPELARAKFQTYADDVRNKKRAIDLEMEKTTTGIEATKEKTAGEREERARKTAEAEKAQKEIAIGKEDALRSLNLKLGTIAEIEQLIDKNDPQSIAQFSALTSNLTKGLTLSELGAAKRGGVTFGALSEGEMRTVAEAASAFKPSWLGGKLVGSDFQIKQLNKIKETFNIAANRLSQEGIKSPGAAAIAPATGATPIENLRTKYNY